jgi:hypothetical protein
MNITIGDEKNNKILQKHSKNGRGQQQQQLHSTQIIQDSSQSVM